jgi:hypothetical protein
VKITSLSPLSLKAGFSKNSAIEQDQFLEMSRQTKRLPGLNETFTKRPDTSVNFLKYSPARFKFRFEKIKSCEKKLIFPTIDADLQLLKEINTKNDQEAFIERVYLRNSRLSCREENTHVNKEKRVRFQLV